MYNSNLLIQFGKNVQEIRLKRNMSIEEVSFKTGINVRYLKKIEKGEAKKVSTKHLYLFIEVFKVRPELLFKDM